MTGLELVLPAAALCYLAACLRDLAARIIPDRVGVALVLLGIVHHAQAGEAAVGLALLVGAGVLLNMLLICAIDLLGGGDAKLLAASAVLLGPGAVPELILLTLLAGGVLAGGYYAAHRLLRAALPQPTLPAMAPGAPRGLRRKLRQAWAAEQRRIRQDDVQLPYALAISCGTFMTISLPL